MLHAIRVRRGQSFGAFAEPASRAFEVGREEEAGEESEEELAEETDDKGDMEYDLDVA